MRSIKRLTTAILVICCIVTQITPAMAQTSTPTMPTFDNWVRDTAETAIFTSTPSDCGGFLITDAITFQTGFTSYPGDCLDSGTSNGIAVKSAPGNTLPNGDYVSSITICTNTTYSGETIFVVTSTGVHSAGIAMSPFARDVKRRIGGDTCMDITIASIITNDIQIFWDFGSGNTCGWTVFPGTIGDSFDGTIDMALITTCPRIDSITVNSTSMTSTPYSTVTLPPSWTPAPTTTPGDSWSLTIPFTNSCLIMALGFTTVASPFSFYSGGIQRVSDFTGDLMAGNFIPHGGDGSTQINHFTIGYGWNYPSSSEYVSLTFQGDTYIHDASNENISGDFSATGSMAFLPVFRASYGQYLNWGVFGGPYRVDSIDLQVLHLNYFVLSGTGTPLDSDYCAGTSTSPTPTISPTPSATPTRTPSATVTPGGPSMTPYPTYTAYPTNTPYLTNTPYPTNTTGPTDTPGGPRTIGALITPTDYPCNADNYVFQNGNNNLGTPCGNLIQWATLALPLIWLPSPTLYVIANTPTAVPITATPNPTNTPTLAATITVTVDIGATGTTIAMIGTATPILDISGLSAMSTAVRNDLATMFPAGNLSVSMNGTPVGAVQLAQQSGSQIGAVIVLARSLAATGFDAGGMISTSVLLLLFIVAIQLIVTIFPLVLYILKLILQVIQTILTPF